VCARFTAVRAVMSRPSVTHNNALGMSLRYLMLDENWRVVERIKAGCVAADDYMTFATRGCSLSVRVCPKADLARDPAWYVAI